ncbi:hypothetical protein A2886_01485 [candidate division WWE3 bacterium RIFCSPHIGHO2_01_FULL_42_13]|uniref:Uncharacterized protein n=1 Tax=candidate division WWE3 bacterium RIFCSPHIGHO2_01_FULL_42_13 TaxID=1802617 RepID=A0A1F4USF5_UNCKA|nr:MAG: hypothetical protein A2886_01485 [candidate division WWE3 bacterium RIFCSPHIGHO2_01_FULL_42_13]
MHLVYGVEEREKRGVGLYTGVPSYRKKVGDFTLRAVLIVSNQVLEEDELVHWELTHSDPVYDFTYTCINTYSNDWEIGTFRQGLAQVFDPMSKLIVGMRWTIGRLPDRTDGRYFVLSLKVHSDDSLEVPLRQNEIARIGYDISSLLW